MKNFDELINESWAWPRLNNQSKKKKKKAFSRPPPMTHDAAQAAFKALHAYFKWANVAVGKKIEALEAKEDTMRAGEYVDGEPPRTKDQVILDILVDLEEPLEFLLPALGDVQYGEIIKKLAKVFRDVG